MREAQDGIDVDTVHRNLLVDWRFVKEAFRSEAGVVDQQRKPGFAGEPLRDTVDVLHSREVRDQDFGGDPMGAGEFGG